MTAQEYLTELFGTNVACIEVEVGLDYYWIEVPGQKPYVMDGGKRIQLSFQTKERLSCYEYGGIVITEYSYGHVHKYTCMCKKGKETTELLKALCEI